MKKILIGIVMSSIFAPFLVSANNFNFKVEVVDPYGISTGNITIVKSQSSWGGEPMNYDLEYQAPSTLKITNFPETARAGALKVSLKKLPACYSFYGGWSQEIRFNKYGGLSDAQGASVYKYHDAPGCKKVDGLDYFKLGIGHGGAGTLYIEINNSSNPFG